MHACIANMVTPSSPTLQLTEKYSHELYVYSRGRCKYDRVKHQQDFYNFKTRQNKEWLWDFQFKEVPEDVFRQYDEMRCSLADEVLVSIKDVMAVTEVETIVKRVKPIDENLLRLIDEKGPACSKAIQDELGEESRDALVRLKARSLIVPRSMHACMQKGGTVDTTLSYTLAVLAWIVLATVGTGMILDAAKKTS
jgi:hypothetical protein